MERIGNYFKWSEFASMGVGEDTIKCGNDIDMYCEFKEPIPLTDEWFVKFGFHKDGEYWSRGMFDYKYCSTKSLQIVVIQMMMERNTQSHLIYYTFINYRTYGIHYYMTR